jgi:hypothetical protein
MHQNQLAIRHRLVILLHLEEIEIEFQLFVE